MKQAMVFWNLQGGKCFYCGCSLRITGVGVGEKPDPRKPLQPWNWDHVQPRSLGHKRPRNTVLSCLPCNQRKAAKLPEPRHIEACARLWDHANQILSVPKKRRAELLASILRGERNDEEKIQQTNTG